MHRNSSAAQVAAVFRRKTGRAPAFVVRAPGRVNLIGEHTDYNDGFVLPLAIDRATWIALALRKDRRVGLESLDHGARTEFGLESAARGSGGWEEYPRAVAHQLRQAGLALQGWEGVSRCDVPMGAGLSSSASFELAVARAFAAVSGWEWVPQAMAHLCRRAENEWVGVACGAMDQLASALGRPDCALLIDCRSGAVTPVPLAPEMAVVVLDTGTRRRLSDSAYNRRRLECRDAAAMLGVAALRDLALDDLDRAAAALPREIYRRVRHVVTENDRTLRAAAALRAGDAAAVGQLMNQSHVSLRQDFEVTNRELDVMAALAQTTPGCHGARMTGAGFGGCAVALVDRSAAEEFARRVAERYQAETGLAPAVHVCRAADGAGLEEVPRAAEPGGAA